MRKTVAAVVAAAVVVTSATCPSPLPAPPVCVQRTGRLARQAGFPLPSGERVENRDSPLAGQMNQLQVSASQVKLVNQLQVSASQVKLVNQLQVSASQVKLVQMLAPGSRFEDKLGSLAERVNSLSKIKGPSELICRSEQIAEDFYRAIARSKKQAKGLIQDPRFFQSLIRILKVQDTLEKLCKKKEWPAPFFYAREKILKKIFTNPELTQAAVMGLGLFDRTSGEEGKLTFAGQESEDFMKNDFPEILDILRDAKKAENLEFLLSSLRMIISFEEISFSEEDGTPLECAERYGRYISLGHNLYVAPVSESFRRHIIFRKDSRGRISSATEIFIPGEKRKGRHLLERARFRISQQMRKRFGEDCGVIKVHLMAEYPQPCEVMAYWEAIRYTKRRPLRIFVYDYSESAQGRRMGSLQQEANMTAAYLKRVKGSRRISTAESITKDILMIIHRFISEGYYFGGDLHLGNFRLCLDGRVRFVGDFDGFFKRKKPPLDPVRSLRNYSEEDMIKRDIALFLSELLKSKGVEFDRIIDEVISSGGGSLSRRIGRKRAISGGT